MKKFLLGLVAGFLLAGLACVIVLFALLRAGDRRPSIPTGGTLVLRLEGEVPELAPVSIPLPWFESQTPHTVLDVWTALRQAARDPKITAILLEPAGVGAGWAKLHELREAVLRFRKSGKPVYARLRGASAREYYLATAAEKIYMSPEDLLDLKGMRAELTYYRNTLDKLGVVMEVEHAGKYKDFADSYTRTSPTPETREVTNAILDQVYNHIAAVIGSARGMAPDKVKATIDDGPFLGEKAVRAGLVDALLQEEQVWTVLAKRIKQPSLQKVALREYMKSYAPASGDGPGRVAVVVGEGAISRGGGDADPFSGEEGIRSGSFIRLLRQVRDDANVRAVILRVNSPGGDAIASDEILHEVRLLGKAKPMVISMSDAAASGGYYISMTGDPVVAYPNTFTGSIGVVYGKVNIAGLYQKLGITTELITRGRNAAIDSSTRPMTPDGRKKLKEGIEATYASFLARVAEGRKKKPADIEPLAQGRVWMGEQAKGNGLVDELGGLDRAVELLRRRVNLGPDERLRLVPYPPKRSLFEQLFSSGADAAAWPEARIGEVVARRRLAALARSLGLEYLDPLVWGHGAILRLAPYTIRLF